MQRQIAPRLLDSLGQLILRRPALTIINCATSCKIAFGFLVEKWRIVLQFSQMHQFVETAPNIH